MDITKVVELDYKITIQDKGKYSDEDIKRLLGYFSCNSLSSNQWGIKGSETNIGVLKITLLNKNVVFTLNNSFLEADQYNKITNHLLIQNNQKAIINDQGKDSHIVLFYKYQDHDALQIVFLDDTATNHLDSIFSNNNSAIIFENHNNCIIPRTQGQFNQEMLVDAISLISKQFGI